MGGHLCPPDVVAPCGQGLENFVLARYTDEHVVVGRMLECV